ncbi:3-hydroxyacyl-CoA dehydrogenase [Caldisphaera lagunensis DSM 15908]|uniref:3-hydroxyacyl-CoA dehydrogenase n=1 Tax=Caldisphaera lagunensis (strain DSM 15908 / JCM 11604 / ANMR 0165 / IC-154) TaxID=1056495 RepID=L0A9V5_CALLD|nr:3-hydroxyacyl-CoA dehydrogenase/enoyl-CoA hydratase family protein [Caldisphaera lagunensis]AFZ69922.1 3-hydroxyacyl-CoA dehydrogenase [Caldisphaera lagunensis DSM 15908]
MPKIERIGILGSGTMGHGIAEVSALYGYDVVMIDVSQEILDNAIKNIRNSLLKLMDKNKVEEVLNKIKVSTEYKDLKDVDLVIEAVPEKFEIKVKVLNEVEKYLKSETIIGTNTSTIPINDLANSTNRMDKFIGIHFMNPPVLMPLVEIILGNETSQETLNKVIEYVKSIKKDYVLVKKDVPGFLINRINMKTFLESIIMYEEGFTKEDIDTMTRFRLNFPMGFMELSDFVGIDTLYNAINEMIKRGEKIFIPKTLNELIKNGKFGVKTGSGFYEYPNKLFKKHNLIPKDSMFKLNPGRIIAVAANEAAYLIRNDIATKEDIEKAMTLGMNWPHGPLYFADHYGIDNIIKILEDRYNKTGFEFYLIDPYLKQISSTNLGTKNGKGFFEYIYLREDLGPVSYEKIEDHAVITIRRPNKLNALNEDVWRNIRIFLEKAEDDKSVKSVVLTGEGNSFCSGDDIEMMKNWKNSSIAKKWLDELAWPLINKMLNYTKPLIAAIKGYAFGGGMELTLLADIVISAENSIFSIPEVLIAAFPPIASPMGTYLTSRRISRYALTGDWLGAEEAKEIGIVDIIVPEDQLDIAVFEVTNKISKISPLSLKAVKNALNNSKTIFVNSLKNSLNELVILADSEDFKEGMNAFIEKRKPVYKGE